MSLEAIPQNRLPDVLLLIRAVDERKSDVMRARRHLDAGRGQSLVHLGARNNDIVRTGLVVVFAADSRGKHLLAINCDNELKRRVLSFDSDVTFGNGIQQSSDEDVLTVGGEIVVRDRASAGAQRQTFNVLPLCDDGTDGISRRSRFSVGVANCGIRDS